MMHVNCPDAGCGWSLKGPKSLIGQRFVCPHCGHRFYWAEEHFDGEDFVVYDLETTGLDPVGDEFIQIAAVRFSGGCLCPEDTFFSFARPRKRISAFIESYTGIGNHHVQGAPRPEDVLMDFGAWAGEGTLIAHNGKRFDAKFLSATCHLRGLPARTAHCIDSIELSKMLFGRRRGIGHSLDKVKERLGLRETVLRRHDARGDVDILGRAVADMHRRLELDPAFNGVRRHTTLLPNV